MAGTVKTLGDPALAGNITPKDEVLIKRLTSEGAIIIGKVLSRLACGSFSCINNGFCSFFSDEHSLPYV